MIENPRYKNLYFHTGPKPITVKKTTAMGPTELCPSIKKQRVKNKVARKTRRINKKNRRK